MFWGLILEPGKRYTTTVDKSFHVSMAALDCLSVRSDQDIMSVMLESDGQENILCNLSKQKVLQANLDLNFMAGDRITFECKGKGSVHLSGYLVSEEEEDEDTLDMTDIMDEEDDDEDEVGSTKPKPASKCKRAMNTSPKEKQKVKKKRLELDNENDSDYDEDSDANEDEEDDGDDEDGISVSTEEGGEGMDASSGSGGEDSDDEDEESEEEDDEQVNKLPLGPTFSKKEKKKLQQQKGQKQQPTPNNKKKTPTVLNGTIPQQLSSGKKDKKKKGNGHTPKQSETPDKPRTVDGGVVIKDIKIGSGPMLKPGKTASVYYVGRLKSNNKVFDQSSQGPGFKFRFGRSEVIKGWDIGMKDMKVGGKRHITCPPNTGYGAKGSLPSIPPNSTLMFEVELKSLS